MSAESLLFAAHRVIARHAIAERPGLPQSVLRGNFWGAVSGFTSTIAHAGSPPLMQYLLPLKLDKAQLVATTVIFFTAVNVVKLVPYGLLGLLDASALGTALVLEPAIPVGYWAALRLVHHLPERVFYWVLVGSLFLIGLKLCWDAFVG